MRGIPDEYEEITSLDGRVLRVNRTPVVEHPIGVDTAWTERWLEMPEYTDPAPDVSSLITRIETELTKTRTLIDSCVCATCGEKGIHAHWRTA